MDKEIVKPAINIVIAGRVEIYNEVVFSLQV